MVLVVAFVLFGLTLSSCKQCGKKKLKKSDEFSSNPASRDCVLDNTKTGLDNADLDNTGSDNAHDNKMTEEEMEWATTLIELQVAKEERDVTREEAAKLYSEKIRMMSHNELDIDNELINVGTTLRDKIMAEVTVKAKFLLLLHNPAVTVERLMVGLNSSGVVISEIIEELVGLFNVDRKRLSIYVVNKLIEDDNRRVEKWDIAVNRQNANVYRGRMRLLHELDIAVNRQIRVLSFIEILWNWRTGHI